MKLTAEQIAAFTCGAIETEFSTDDYHFSRFYPEQISAFVARAQIYDQRCRSTCGIRLEFETDSTTIRVDVKAAGRYELLVDGLQVVLQNCDAGDTLYANLGEGNKYITVMLPWHSEGVLSFVMLDEGAYAKPHQFDRKFLFLGDSITQGSTSKQDSLAYACRVARWFNADYINQGVGGTKFFPETLVKPNFEPDTVFIAYGTNDFNSMPSIEVIEDNCRKYLDTVKSWYPSARIYVISPLWRLDGNMVRAAGTLDQVREVIIKQTEAHGLTHIDGYKLVPHDPMYYADKRLHPDALGMSIYAEQLLKMISK